MEKNLKIGVGYYNIDNVGKKENRENIVNDFSLLTEAVASQSLTSSQEMAEPKSICEIQAPTPPSMKTIKRMISQIFYNENSTQKHKLKVKLHHTDCDPTEWIATMNTDPRVFRKYNDIKLARIWIEMVREKFPKEKGFKNPYYGKFHCVADAQGRTGGTQKEPGCFAAMSYNTYDKSWYVIMRLFDFGVRLEYDYNFTKKQADQGVKAQIVWNNPELQQNKRPQTWAQRNGVKL